MNKQGPGKIDKAIESSTNRHDNRGGWAMNEKPILFSAPMVRAILNGKKTQTRRVLKNQPPGDAGDHLITLRPCRRKKYEFMGDPENGYEISIKPYAFPGDRLWVKEAWAASRLFDLMPPRDIPDGADLFYRADGGENWNHNARVRSSLHMTRRASRTTLEITDVRIERLNDISGEDAISEGSQIPCDQLPKSCRQGCLTERTQFSRIWDSINGKKCPWRLNPWVWVISFRRIKP